MPNYELAAERAARKIGVNPRIFKAMIRAESNFNPNAGSPAGARGIAQFMPATAKGYGVNLDDGRVTDDLEGAARYLKANLARTGGNYSRALSIYNSGKPDKYLPGGYPETINYVKKIMGGRNRETLLEGGGSVTGGAAGGTGGRRVGGGARTEVVSPAVDNSAARVQLLQSFLRNKNADPVDLALQVRQAQDVPAVTRNVTESSDDGGGDDGEPAKGTYTVAPGANRAGVGLTDDMKRFLAGMTRSGRNVTVTTGSNHNRNTTTGNVSDHWSGNGVDIGSSANGFPATGGGVGDLIAAHAIKQASGKSWKESLALARKGGAYTFNRNGKRTQVLYKTQVGGNHDDHVHIGRG